ncbi:DsbA family protein [Roseobacteraceae bacterium S113]
MSEIIYIYSAHSAFAYLGSTALSEIATRHGALVRHCPVLLSPVLADQGSLPFAARTQAHVDYFFGREIERWAELRGVPVVQHRPTHHDADYALASGMIIALGESGAATDAMAHALLEAHWRDDIDLSDRSALARVARELGHDVEALLARAGSAAVQEALAHNTAWAASQPVFGSPTYIVGGDPFYGQDRLELVDRALTRPFAPSQWHNPPVG